VQCNKILKNAVITVNHFDVFGHCKTKRHIMYDKDQNEIYLKKIEAEQTRTDITSDNLAEKIIYDLKN